VLVVAGAAVDSPDVLLKLAVVVGAVNAVVFLDAQNVLKFKFYHVEELQTDLDRAQDLLRVDAQLQAEALPVLAQRQPGVELLVLFLHEHLVVRVDPLEEVQGLFLPQRLVLGDEQYLVGHHLGVFLVTNTYLVALDVFDEVLLVVSVLMQQFQMLEDLPVDLPLLAVRILAAQRQRTLELRVQPGVEL